MTRSIFLRLMLVALGLSALLAIVSIYAADETSWRLLTTTILVAVTCGLMLPIAPRDAGLGMDLLQRTVFGFLCISLAICLQALWGLGGGRLDEVLVWVWFLIGVPSLTICMMGMRSRRSEDRSMALAERVAIAGSFIATGAALLAIAVDQTNPEVALIVGFIFVAGAIGAAGSAIGRRGPSTERFAPPPNATRLDRTLATIGVSAGIAWCLLASAAYLAGVRAWQPGFARSMHPLWPFATACITLAIPCAIWCGIGLSRVTGPLRFLRHSSAATTFALGALVVFIQTRALDNAMFQMPDYLGRLISALIVISLASLIAALIMMRLNRGRAVAADPIESIEWACPRCTTRTQIGMGEHSCANCGLAVIVALRDDRCPACAYDLRGQPAGASTCPECGRARQLPVTSA